MTAPDAPKFYRGVVAAAFHDDATADRRLREIAVARPVAWKTPEANRLLGQVRLRWKLRQRDARSHPTILRHTLRGGHTCVPATINGRKVDDTTGCVQLDVSVDFRVRRGPSLHFTARNLSNTPLKTEIYTDTTPAFARLRQSVRFRSANQMGVKGTF